MRRIALGFLLCSLWSASSALAQAPPLCEPRFWSGATRQSVSIMLQRGDRPWRHCPNRRNGDTPLHVAAAFANDAGAVHVLLGAAGARASTAYRNRAGETAVDLFLRRWECGGAGNARLSALYTLLLGDNPPPAREQPRTARNERDEQRARLHALLERIREMEARIRELTGDGGDPEASRKD